MRSERRPQYKSVGDTLSTDCAKSAPADSAKTSHDGVPAENVPVYLTFPKSCAIMNQTRRNCETRPPAAGVQDRTGSVSVMRFYASVTQLTESGTYNPVDASSNLAGGFYDPAVFRRRNPIRRSRK